MASPRRRSAHEFFEKDAEEHPAAVEEDLPSAHTSNNSFGPMDLDVSLTPEEIAKAQESLYLATGWYVWHQGKVRVSQFFLEHDKAPSDKRPEKGRMTFLISGVATTLDGQHKGGFSFSASPDYRTSRDGSKGDPRYENWGRCTELFFRVHERQPSGPTALAELVTLLEQGGYQMYIRRGESGNFLNQLRKFA